MKNRSEYLRAWRRNQPEPERIKRRLREVVARYMRAREAGTLPPLDQAVTRAVRDYTIRKARIACESL